MGNIWYLNKKFLLHFVQYSKKYVLVMYNFPNHSQIFHFKVMKRLRPLLKIMTHKSPLGPGTSLSQVVSCKQIAFCLNDSWDRGSHIEEVFVMYPSCIDINIEKGELNYLNHWTEHLKINTWLYIKHTL
jgi:hypothetical protein